MDLLRRGIRLILLHVGLNHNLHTIANHRNGLDYNRNNLYPCAHRLCNLRRPGQLGCIRLNHVDRQRDATPRYIVGRRDECVQLLRVVRDAGLSAARRR